MLRILIVDDQKTIRETLKAIFELETGLKVVGTANDGQSAVELAKSLLPDLMLVDLEMPGLDGLNLTRIIHQDLPNIKVIVLSMHDRDEYIQQSLQAGAMGYLLKNTPSKDLIEAIHLVNRGYTQFSPGLIHKVIPTIESRDESETNSFGLINRDSSSNNSPNFALSKLETNSVLVNQAPRIRKSWKYYLPFWLAGNALLWGLAIGYLIFKSPTYTSKWAISLPASKNTSSVDIPDVGSLRSNTESPYHNSLFDPREDYKFLLQEKELLSVAAAKVGLERTEYGKPEVKIVDNTTMMELAFEGDSPEEAQQKAIALQSTLELKLQELRQGQIDQSDLNLQGSLAKAEIALDDARQKLAKFRATSAMGSQNRAGNLSSNVEALRRQQAEVKAELQQTQVKSQRLADNLGMSAQLAKNAFALHSDSLFQRYLTDYTNLNGELVNLEGRFQSNSPIVQEKRSEVDTARQALLSRSGSLLGHVPSSQLLEQLNLSTGEEDNSYRGSLLKDIVSFQSDADGLRAKEAELAQQIANLEAKENKLVGQDATLAKLQQEVKFAETLYSSTLAKSRLAESNIYDAYPQIQVAIQPNLPQKPSAPDPALVGLGAFMGSVFFTTAIASLWVSSSAKPTISIDNDDHLNGNHKSLAPAGDLTDLNSLLKK